MERVSFTFMQATEAILVRNADLKSHVPLSCLRIEVGFKIFRFAFPRNIPAIAGTILNLDAIDITFPAKLAITPHGMNDFKLDATSRGPVEESQHEIEFTRSVYDRCFRLILCHTTPSFNEHVLETVQEPNTLMPFRTRPNHTI